MQKTIVCIVFICSMLSCHSDPTEMGADFFSDGAIDISYIDSVTVTLSTVKFDSLITGNATRILIGTHNDVRLGPITASAVMELHIPASSSLTKNQASYAYLALCIKPDGYFFYDTTSLTTFHVRRLTEKLNPGPTGYLYNTSSFKAATNSLGSISFFPKPHRDDSLQIILSDALGLELYDKIINQHKEILSQSEFTKYFKGVAIVPDNGTSSSILGFSSSPELRLYYNDKSKIPAEVSYISFKSTSGLVYSNIQADYTATKLSSLKTSSQKVKASATNDESYLQGGTGLALRIDMPHLRSLAQFNNFFISKAYLEFYPVRKSITETTPLPNTLFAYKVNKRNSLIDENGLGVRLSIDLSLERDTHYQIDVTQFVKDQIALQEFNENGLMITLPSSDNTVSIDKLSVASRGSEHKARLKIYFATINTN